MSPTEIRTTGLTYDDLQQFPDDHFRREIIDGELLVTPAPILRHQRAVGLIHVALFHYAEEHGGETFVAPTDVFLSERDVVEPDVLFVTADHADRLEERLVRGPPDLVVEVSSPTTRRRDVGIKRDLYERKGVIEYWFVDLDADRVERYVLEGGVYAPPEMLEGNALVTSPLLPGFEATVSELIPPQAA